jgi:hypothetical protein
MMRLVIGIALLGGLIGIARADVKCPPGHEDECGTKRAFYYLCPDPIFMGYKCWCDGGRSCYPCDPMPNCQEVCGGNPNAIGVFFPPW